MVENIRETNDYKLVCVGETLDEAVESDFKSDKPNYLIVNKATGVVECTHDILPSAISLIGQIQKGLDDVRKSEIEKDKPEEGLIN